jgi:hypothetical protein
MGFRSRLKQAARRCRRGIATFPWGPILLGNPRSNVSSSILDRAVAYSKSKGSNGVMTDDAPIILPSGKSAQFTSALAQSLSIASTASLQVGTGDWWAAGWVYFDFTGGQTMQIAGKWSGSLSSAEWTMQVNNGTPIAVIYDSTGTPKQNAYGTAFTPGRWYFWLVWMDATAQTWNLQIDNGAVVSISTAGFTPNSATASPFALGARIAVPDLYLNGRQDSVCFGKAPGGGVASIIAALRTSLWNNGAGKGYADTTPAERTAWGMTSWWDLDETSGTRIDSRGPNSLTDNGGVTTGLPRNGREFRSIVHGLNDTCKIVNGYLRFPNASGTYASIPDSPALSITGDIDIQVQAAVIWAYTPATQMLVAKWSAVGQLSYRLFVQTTGALTLSLISDGTNGANATSSAVLGLNHFTPKWVRATWRQSDGRVQFWTSDDGVAWTQLGTNQTISNVTVPSIFDSTSVVEIGSSILGTTSLLASGKVYRIRIYGDLAQTDLRLDANFTGQANHTTSFAESSPNHATVSIIPSADNNDPKFLGFTGVQYAYFPGAASNNATTPNAAALNVVGDLDLRIQLAMDKWTPAAESVLINKGPIGASGYYLSVVPAGTLNLYWFNGAANVFKGSTVATGVADGSLKWIRATLDVDNGAGGNTVTFYTSDDGVAWTVLGAPVVTAGVTSITAATGVLAIGSLATGSNVCAGKFYRAQVYDGIGGTRVFDADFTDSTLLVEPFTSFTEKSSNGATVTINRGATGRKLEVVNADCYVLGTDDQFDIPDAFDLNFQNGDSFTACVLIRQYGINSGKIYISKRAATGAGTGWVISSNAGAASARVADGTLLTDALAAAIPAGVTTLLSEIRSVSLDKLTAALDGTPGTPVTDTTTGTLANTSVVRIGADTPAAGGYADIVIFGWAIFREALTASDLALVKAALLS